jgi:hypothetical protein
VIPKVIPPGNITGEKIIPAIIPIIIETILFHKVGLKFIFS